MSGVAWIVVVCIALVSAQATAAPSSAFPRPDHTEHANLARWLAHKAEWGTLSTVNAAGAPVGGVVSFSDGAPGNPSGRLFFYLTPMDETAQNLERDPSCALTIAESQLPPTGCSGTDPEDPTCAKISVLGTMHDITNAQDADAAAAALFTRHPAMQQWPPDHGFKLCELKIREIHMLDWYGGMHVITAEDYFAALAGPSSSSSGSSSSGSSSSSSDSSTSSASLRQRMLPSSRPIGRIAVQ